MKIVGIDPGKSGWWCYLDSETGYASAEPLPFREDGVLDVKEMPNSFDFAYTEKVHVNGEFMPASSAFTFGLNVGQILCWISSYSYVSVPPRTWQKLIYQGIDTKLEIKGKSRAAFAKMNPHYQGKLNHNMTDAFHIANYGMMQSGVYRGDWQWQCKKEISARSKK